MKPSSCAILSLAFLAACASLQGDKQHDREAQDVQMAQSLRHSGNTAGAVQVLRQAQADFPNDPIILSQLGYALIANGQPSEAIDVFGKLIALHPDDVSAYNGKAVALDRGGKHFEAQKLYQQALKLSPDSLSIKNNLAMSMILNNQAGQAIPLLEELNRQGSNPTVRQNLALAYGIEGEKQKALDLNLQDMPEAEAKENMRFYDQYTEERRKLEDASGTTPPDADEESLFDKPPAATDDKSSYPQSLDDLLSSKSKPAAAAHPVADAAPVPAQATPKDKTENEDDSTAAVAPLAPPPAPVSAPAYPSQGAPSATVLPTANPVSATPASQKQPAPPPVATPGVPATPGQSKREDNAAPVAEAQPDDAAPLANLANAGLLPAPPEATFTPAPAVAPAITEAEVQHQLGEKLQALIPTAEGAEPLAVQHPHHRHRRKKKQVDAPVEAAPPPSFLGVNNPNYSYPTQGRRDIQ